VLLIFLGVIIDYGFHKFIVVKYNRQIREIEKEAIGLISARGQDRPKVGKRPMQQISMGASMLALLILAVMFGFLLLLYLCIRCQSYIINKFPTFL